MKNKKDSIKEYELKCFEPEDGLEHALIFFDVLELFQDYHIHKDSKSLGYAIRNRPELFESEIFRNFVADIFDGTYKPSQKYIFKRTVIKNRKICATVNFYHNMGFPIYYDSSKKNKFNACQLTSKKHHISATTIPEILGNEKIKNYGSTAFTGHGFEVQDGTIIWILNGFKPPESLAEIEKLENKLKSLSETEYKRAKKFSLGYVATNCKVPKTIAEANEIEKVLNSREDYDFIKSLQLRHITAIK